MIPWFTLWLHYLNFSYKEGYHEVRFEKESRYYMFRLEKDLLDDWTIIIVNGRIKSKLGQSRILAFSTYTNAFGQFLNMIKIRYKRNYQLITLHSENVISLYYLIFFLISRNFSNITNAKSQKKKKSKLTPNNRSATNQNFPSKGTSSQLILSF